MRGTLGRRIGRGLCAALVVVPAVGCGNKYQMAEVRGRVTCDGKPATGGEVAFEPIDDPARTGRPPGRAGRTSHGIVQDDGSFTLVCDLIPDSGVGHKGPGALVGPHRVFFTPPPTKRPTMSAESRKVLEEVGQPGELKAFEEAYAKIPIYPPLPCGTGIDPGEVEVKPGQNEFEFKLQPK